MKKEEDFSFSIMRLPKGEATLGKNDEGNMIPVFDICQNNSYEFIKDKYGGFYNIKIKGDVACIKLTITKRDLTTLCNKTKKILTKN